MEMEVDMQSIDYACLFHTAIAFHVWCVYMWMYTCYYAYNDSVILYYITQALNIGSMYKIMKKKIK